MRRNNRLHFYVKMTDAGIPVKGVLEMRDFRHPPKGGKWVDITYCIGLCCYSPTNTITGDDFTITLADPDEGFDGNIFTLGDIDDNGGTMTVVPTTANVNGTDLVVTVAADGTLEVAVNNPAVDYAVKFGVTIVAPGADPFVVYVTVNYSAA